MNKYIDSEKLIAEITRIYNEHQCRSTERYEDGIDDGYHDCCDEIVAVITSLQQEAQEEEKVRKERYNESFMSYWKIVINTIDKKRALPSFKGKLLHDFKNELHTMKQIVGLINHPEIHEGLFDRLALVFAAWGGYHFHPEDALQQEQPEGGCSEKPNNLLREQPEVDSLVEKGKRRVGWGDTFLWRVWTVWYRPSLLRTWF